MNRRRLARHVSILLGGLVASFAIARLFPDASTLQRASLATAYVALLLLALTLVLGPLKVIRRQPNPVSTYLRRDLGIWAALFGLAHTVLGLQVHLGGRFWFYFVPQPRMDQWLPVRYDLFGLTNHVGLVATVVLLVLLAISSNRALRRLGVARWKSLQRFSYLIAVLVVAHGLVYQVLEKRHWAYIGMLVVLAALVIFVQLVGRKRFKDGRAPGRASGS
ncbi:MAG: ferric reductase-like transmembrane domain-containing protein [Alphaproteobacteria bacterium]